MTNQNFRPAINSRPTARKQSLWVVPLLLLPLSLELTAIASVSAAVNPTHVPTLSPTEVRLNQGEWLEARRYRYYRRRYRLPSWGAPRWSTGGAARGGCNAQESPLIPLMPVDSTVTSQGTDGQKEPTFFGVTTEAHPTFFAYVPATTAKAVEFLLLDEESETLVYQKSIPINGTPQVISFKIDGSLPALKPGTNYKWSFATICNLNDQSRDASGNPYIEGLMQRAELEPSLVKELQKRSPRDHPALYVEKGFWLDALNRLAQLRCAAPNDTSLAADWAELLQTMELERLPKLSQLVDRTQIPKASLAQCQVRAIE